MIDGPLFEFEAVGVSFGDNQVLAEVQLALPERELVMIVGPSGSGKSTLLRTLNRLEVPSAGTIRFRGDQLVDLDVHHHRRTVGMVFQRPTLFNGTVAENLRVADPSLDAAGISSLLERVRLSDSIADQDADTVSGGEAQRACLARTLATRPDVVLLDEATSALDEDHRRGIEELVRDLVEDGTSIVWVTHDRAQVDRCADRVVVVDKGTARLEERP